MTFSAPGLLWAAALGLAPLLLHWISRRRARREPFGDHVLLRRALAQALPASRLRAILLMASRCALLALLALAYAGPVAAPPERGASPASKDGGAAAAGLDLILALDVSYSMGARLQGRSLLDLAKDAGETLIASLGREDRVAVLAFSDRLEPPAERLEWQAPEDARALLRRASTTSRPTDFMAAVRPAAALLSRGRRGKAAVVLLSDGAAHGLRAGFAPPEGAELLALRLPPVGGNGAVLRASLSGDQRSLSALARGPAPGWSSQLDLWLGGRRSATRSLKAGAQREASAEIPLPEGEGAGSLSGRAVLRPDALAIDDEFFFSLERPRRPRLLCLHGDADFFRAPRAGFFLKEALGQGQASLLDFDADFAPAAKLAEIDLRDYRAVILSDFAELPPAASRLETFVRQGGGLIVIPGSRGGPASFSALAELLPAAVGEAQDSWQARGLKGPWAQAKGFDFERVAVARHYRLSPKPGASALLLGAGGQPLLAAWRRGEGRVALWASALEPSWSNLALKPYFPAWLSRLAREVSPPERQRREGANLVVGQTLVRTWSPREPAPSRVRVLTPDGRAASVVVRDRRVEFSDTELPGLYRLIEEGSAVPSVYAVNADRTLESELASPEAPPWTALRAEALLEDFRKALFGRDLRPWAFALALLLLAAESLLSLPAVRAKRPEAVRRAAAALIPLLLLLVPARVRAQQGDRFVWTQLKHGPDWDPYPGAAGEVLGLLSTVTSVISLPERRVITLKDPLLFSSPLVLLAGRQAPPALDEEETRALRDFLSSGGTLWLEDVSGAAASSFDLWVRRQLPLVLPEHPLETLEPSHVIYKTFFLLRAPAGRAAVKGSLEAAVIGGRAAVIYSRNDMLGAWAKDALGRPLLRPAPGGEAQRMEARKTTINLLMYSLTGSYKADAVHQPFLLQKIKAGAP